MYINRDREVMHASLVNDYFGENPFYPDASSNGSKRENNLLIVEDIFNHSKYFTPNFDSCK